MPERIYLPGYDDLRKVLKEVGDIEGSKELKAAGHAVASEIVVPGAQARAAGLGALEQKAAATLKAARIDTGGAVRFGGGFAAAFGAEFGAARNQRRNTSRGLVTGWNQFQPWRGSGPDAGYFLWPTIHAETARIVEAIGEYLAPLFKRAFPERG